MCGVSAEDRSIGQLLDEAASIEHGRTANVILGLLDRLGRDGLSQDEWNALVLAEANERIEGWRRGRRADTPDPEYTPRVFAGMGRAGS